MPKSKDRSTGSSDPRLPLQEAAHVLKTFSLGGASRIPLENMACWTGNRQGMGVNGRRAHNLYKRITQEGFVRMRYNRGLALAPNPLKPFDNAEFTNDYCHKQREFLCGVKHAHLPGSFSKTHLWHILLTAKQGNYVYYQDQTPLVPNMDDEEMVMTLRDGMFYEVLDYKAYLEHPDAIQFLMKSENADASQALKNTEIALVKEYFQMARRVMLGPGQDLWTVLKDKVDGEAFSNSTRMACCALAMKLTDAQMLALVDIFQYYVDPSEREWGPAQVTAVSNMPAKYPWCKTAPLVANLVCSSTTKDKTGSSLSVGTAVAVKDLERLASVKTLSEPVWTWMEDTFRKILQEVYVSTTLQRCDSHTLLHLGSLQFPLVIFAAPICSKMSVRKVTCSFLTRCGTAMGKAASTLKTNTSALDATDKATLKENFAHAEARLRRDLMEAGIDIESVERVLDEVPLSGKDAKKAAPKGSAESSASVIAPIVLDKSGKVKDSFQNTVTEQGFHIGTKVQIGTGSTVQEGRVLQITATHVHLEVQSLRKDGPMEKVELDAKQMKQKRLQLLELAPVDKATKVDLGPDTRQPPREWQPVYENQAQDAVNAWVKLAMFHMQQHCTPTAKMVRSHTETDGLHFSMEIDVAEKGLVLIPFSNNYAVMAGPPPEKKRKTTKSGGEPCKSIYIKYCLKGGSDDYLQVLKPDDSKPENAGKSALFWRLLSDDKYAATGPSALSWSTCSIEVPLKASVVDKGSKGAITKCSTQATLQLTFPVLTNKDELKARSMLTVPRGDAPCCL